jgi:hypothetical protein
MRSVLVALVCLVTVACSRSGQQNVVESPFFCNLNALNAEERERYAELTASLAAAVEELRELPDGYALRLSDAMPLGAAGQWAEFETRCCPFFGIRLEKSREGGPVWLHLTGREGVKAFIREEFGL